ncbi:MAG: SPFH domain-containing protein [Myxococcales bacterium]|jgi:membrane protease subunit (stomatin/prohibitin family)
MGIIDFIKSGVGDLMIARPDSAKGDLVYKHPDQTIPNRANLTIDADEAAVFFKDGAIVGTLRTAGAGQRHTLTSENIPFLDRIVDKFTGGNVFVTDLFFVTLRPVFNQRFGGELGMMEDPLLGEMVTPRIYGTYSFQIVDPEAFILKYMGLQGGRSNEDLLKWVNGLLMNSIKTVVGQVCVSEQKSMLELMPLQQMLAQKFMESSPDLNAIGCRIVDMGEFALNLSDGDEARLKEAQSEIGAAKRAARVANIGISEAEAKARQRQFELDQDFQNDSRYVQNLAGNYSNYAAGQAMIGAGKGMSEGGGGGEGGGAMAGGAALGVGFGMAQAMAQGLQPGAGGGQAPQPPAQEPPPPSGPTTCSACNAQVPGGRFCAECGASLTPKPRFCSACGTEGAAGAKFCANCGTAFSQ